MFEEKRHKNVFIKFFKKAWKFIYNAILKYLRDDITVKAAGLAFYQLLTIIPVMMLIFYILGRILNNETVFYKVLKSSTIFKPDIQVIVMKNIKKIMETGILTAVFGFFLFLFLTRKYLRELMFAVRKIIGENPNRPKSIKANVFRYIKNFLVQLMYIIFYVIAISLSSALSGLALNFFGVLHEVFGSVPPIVSFIIRLLILLIPVTFYTGFYYFIYWHSPDYRPIRKFALIGAVFTTITNEILRFFYKLYVERFLYKSNIYGTLSTVAALVIWYYVSSIIVLFGAIIVYMLNEEQKHHYSI